MLPRLFSRHPRNCLLFAENKILPAKPFSFVKARLFTASVENDENTQYVHPKQTEKAVYTAPGRDISFLMTHPIWSEEELKAVTKMHRKPVTINDRLAYWSVQFLRRSFDCLSGYKRGKLTERKVVVRVVFLETVAGVPGLVCFFPYRDKMTLLMR